MIFETERLVVRRFTANDAEIFFRLNGSADVMRYIRSPKNRKECDAFLLENINLYRDGSVIGRYAVQKKDPGSVIGMFSILYLAGADDLHIGYALLPGEWGKGYATELAHEGKAWFFANTDRKELLAVTNPGNKQSQKVLLKAGFEKKEDTPGHNGSLSIFCTHRPEQPDC